MNSLHLIAFIIFSSLLLLFTLRRPHSHRFYRFFAFESILVLIFINADHWFSNPFAPLQLISWFLLASSLGLALHGFSLLKNLGAPTRDIEYTTQLVTTGAYRYIRHPLYASLILFGLGAMLKNIGLPVILVFLVLLSFLYATARVEEADNAERFGEAYRSYILRTKMFIPFIF